MSDRQLTTFPSLTGYEQAAALLEGERIPFERIVAPAWLSKVAVPAIVVDREGRSRWADACDGIIACSGWVEYRRFRKPNPYPSSEEPGMDVFSNAAITVLQPCVADDTKIRFVAGTTGDIAQAMPYLNAVMPHVSYSPQAQTVTYMEQHRMIVLYSSRITVAKADDIMDAWLCLERIRRQVNRTWEQRDKLVPRYETRKKPPALEIFKRLPGTNCGLCGEMTCMTFALRLWSGAVELSSCSPVFEPRNRELKDALAEICAGLGISIED